ncbi:restriction endonuclease subunit S [Bradyrhizobium sp. SZCCHNRI3043]|uniref:restriction endonuclease subunit S n=1 Tax=Bradyrhizobium sp. SZCCHNRI3043 TaxID=3057292 RepID=UPI0028E24499|nr:restriction endonuclease subunit S [Bradyrhizobium sp. SZCCHNRI3043]
MNALTPFRSKTWPRVRLGEVAEHRLGKMLDNAKNTGELRPYLRNPNIRWFEIDLNDLQEIRVEDNELHKYELRPGDVLICEGGEAGRAAIWNGEAEGIIFQKACHRVRVGSELDARFLVHCLMHDYFSGKLSDYYTGATIKHLTGQDLARYEIPLPPIEEQRRIAAILDKADALRRKRRHARRLLDSVAQSIFFEMFGDPLRANGQKVQLIEVVEGTQIGPFGSLLHREDYKAGGIPLINPMHINGGLLTPSPQVAISAEKFESLKAYQLRLGDIVMGRRGEMGRCAEVVSREKLVCGTGSLFIRPNFSKALPAFLQALISSPSAIEYFEGAAAGITMPNLNKAVVDKLSFVLPPIEDQERFSLAKERVQQEKKRAAEADIAIDALFSSLQYSAFSGLL